MRGLLIFILMLCIIFYFCIILNHNDKKNYSKNSNKKTENDKKNTSENSNQITKNDKFYYLKPKNSISENIFKIEKNQNYIYNNIITVKGILPINIYGILYNICNSYNIEIISLDLILRSIENHLYHHMTNFSEYFKLNCKSTTYRNARRINNDHDIEQFFKSQYLIVKNNHIFKHEGKYNITKFCYSAHVSRFYKQLAKLILIKKISYQIILKSIDKNKKYLIFGENLDEYFKGEFLSIISMNEIFNIYEFKKQLMKSKFFN